MFWKSLFWIAVPDYKFIWGQNQLLYLQTSFMLGWNPPFCQKGKHICTILWFHMWRMADTFDRFIQVIGAIFTLFVSQRSAIKWWKWELNSHIETTWTCLLRRMILISQSSRRGDAFSLKISTFNWTFTENLVILGMYYQPFNCQVK